MSSVDYAGWKSSACCLVVLKTLKKIDVDWLTYIFSLWTRRLEPFTKGSLILSRRLSPKLSPCVQTFILPRDAMLLAMGVCCLCVSCVRHKPVLSKKLHRLNCLFSQASLDILHWKEIKVSRRIRVLPSGTLSQTLELEKFLPRPVAIVPTVDWRQPIVYHCDRPPLCIAQLAWNSYSTFTVAQVLSTTDRRP